MNKDNIPEELKDLNQWVVWGVLKDKPKMPFNPTNMEAAKAGQPETWGSYKEAVNRVTRGQARGIGFEFSDNGIYGVDLDKVIIDGELTPDAKQIVSVLDSYTEISQSGNGLHILVKANNIILQAKRKGFIEMYHKERYFIVTGNIYGELKPIQERNAQLSMVYGKYLKPKPVEKLEVISNTDYEDDNSFLEKGLKKDKILINLWNGNRPNGNESSDDQALFNKLAYWCNCNEHLMKKAFFDSLHYSQKDDKHKKKCNRQDYIINTINEAVSTIRDTARSKNERYLQSKATSTAKKQSPKSQANISNMPNLTASSVPYINIFNTLESRQRYQWNDIGCGNLFADTFKESSRYVPEAKSWYHYNGKVWVEDIGNIEVSRQAKDLINHMITLALELDDADVKNKYLEFVRKRTQKKYRDTMLKDAESVHPISITSFDRNVHIFNCQNGTLNLKTLEFTTHKASDFLSKISNVTYKPNVKCERWGRFISEIMNNDAETAKFLQKSLGYTCTGETSKECFFVLYGATTRNGKGTTCETMLYMLGDYGKTAQPESIAQKSFSNSSAASEDIARLRGARFVNMSEPDKGLRLNTALVKQLTGADTITARFLHKNSFEFKPEFKIFLSTNHLPRVTDESIFQSGRVMLIPFERHFKPEERDTGLKQFFRKHENISGIFNWCLEGLTLLAKEGLELPKAVAEATQSYEENSDIIGQFISDTFLPCENSLLKTKMVYELYTKWCNENGHTGVLGRNNFVEELRKRKMIKVDRNLGNTLSGYIFLRDYPQEFCNQA